MSWILRPGQGAATSPTVVPATRGAAHLPELLSPGNRGVQHLPGSHSPAPAQPHAERDGPGRAGWLRGQPRGTSPRLDAAPNRAVARSRRRELAGPSDYNNVQDISGALGATLRPDFRDRRAVTWVGLGGLEPPTSSLSGMAAAQVSRHGHPLTSAFIPQHPPGCPSGMHPLDASVTHTIYAGGRWSSGVANVPRPGTV
jgi:hypothetical protein